MSTLQDADALPQLIGDYKPLDEWQAHLNTLFYRLRGDKLRTYYQTFASADFRLAHALAADYFEKVVKRDKLKPSTAPLIVMELGPGNGNLAACFLSHLKAIDKAGQVYPRVKYVLVDWEQSILDGALTHPDLAPAENLQLSDDRIMQAVEFILRRQNDDGGFGTYERRRGGPLLELINPSEMYGQCMTELSYIECTASCVAALAHIQKTHPQLLPHQVAESIGRGAGFLRAQQRPDGSFLGFWGINFTYAAFHIAESLTAAGVDAGDRCCRHAKERGAWRSGIVRAGGNSFHSRPSRA